MCLYSSLDSPCSHAQCSIVTSIMNANRDVIRHYNQPTATSSTSEIHRHQPVEVVDRESLELMVADQPVEIVPQPESEKEPTLENFAVTLQDMRHQIDGLQETQRLIMGLLQQLLPAGIPK